MATTIDEVADLFLSLVQDYRLISLYNTSGSANFGDYVENWLLLAIDDFDVCTQALTYSTTTQTFTVDLTQQNKNILAQIMVLYWLQKEIHDVQQMRLHLQDRDFKSFSEAQNFTAKQNAYNAKKEEISNLLVRYGLRNNDWTSWKDQDFD